MHQKYGKPLWKTIKYMIVNKNNNTIDYTCIDSLFYSYVNKEIRELF